MTLDRQLVLQISKCDVVLQFSTHFVGCIDPLFEILSQSKVSLNYQMCGGGISQGHIICFMSTLVTYKFTNADFARFDLDDKN